MTKAEIVLVTDIEERLILRDVACRRYYSNYVNLGPLARNEDLATLDAWERKSASDDMRTLLRLIEHLTDEAAQTIAALEAENMRLHEWRTEVTAALQKPGGCCYADVPREIRALREHVEAMSETLKNCGCQCEDMPQDTA